ncbi:hypothetical protein HED38_10215 [Vagococcus fluvialis]|nr:hypothetical protein [Vagococcus fluvialis]
MLLNTFVLPLTTVTATMDDVTTEYRKVEKSDENNINQEIIKSSETFETTKEIDTFVDSTSESFDDKTELTKESTTESTAELTEESTKENIEEPSKSVEKIEQDDQGPYISYNKYVTVVDVKAIFYQNFSWKEKSSAEIHFGKTYLAKGKYEHSNGNVYLSIYDNKDVWLGYLIEEATEVGNGRQGAYQTYGRYVTISNDSYPVHSNFSWEEKNSSKNLYGKTYQARGKYEHFNGSTYLSLYDNNGIWQGYINAKATRVGDGRQGAYQAYGKYVTVSNANYPIHSNFSWKEKNKSKNLYSKTYQARGKYEHFNGSTYLSLYDNNGIWQGYINAKATRVGDGRQGAYQAYGKYVTVTNNTYSTYRNFSWSKLNTSKNMYGKTYEARGKYVHFNGFIYLSLFDSSGEWYGYINSNAVTVSSGQQGVYQSLNRHVIVNNKNYNMWQDFNWNPKQSSSKFYNKGLVARGKYVHYNGSTYYSLYDGSGKWQGYLNSSAATLVSYYEKPTTYYSQMAIGAWYGCAATSLYTALKSKGYANNISLVNFINGLPLSKNNPDEGQIGSPWSAPFTRVISPIGLNKYARKYTSNTEVLTGSSIDRVITEINSGNVVLFWGRYLMDRPDLYENPQHVMIAKGYKVVGGKEYILVQDPGLYTSTDPKAIRWFEKKAFDNYLTKKQRKMMVIR